MTPEQRYYAQFSGESLTPELIIQTAADMQAFNDMTHQRWTDEHAEVIKEWQNIKDEQCHLSKARNHEL